MAALHLNITLVHSIMYTRRIGRYQRDNQNR